jgi:agmatinase
MLQAYLQRKTGFLGASEDYEKAQAVLVGLPMDYTVSLRPGARFGPQQIRNISFGLEMYSPAQDRSLENIAYFDAGDVFLPFGNTVESLKRIEEVARNLFADEKFPLFLGGEHLVTLPLIKACVNYFPELVAFHFDAHTDLREQFEGEENSHATVMRKAADLLRPKSLYQFGIRSGVKEEFEFAKKHTNLYQDEIFPALHQAVKEAKGKPVYITLDIDVADPAFAPGTGTPEPGGCSAREILEAVWAMKDLQVVGMDLVEVAPAYDQSERTAILAAKLVREALLAFVNKS